MKYIATSLVSFLRGAAKPGLRSILGLSELHTTAFGEHIDGEAILHLQDADGKMFAKIVLTPAEKTQWLRALAPHAEG